MSSTQNLREQRANIWEQMKGLNARAEAANRDLDAEERRQYDALDADLDSLDDRIQRAEKAEKREAEYNRVDRTGVVAPEGHGSDADLDSEAEYADVFARFLRQGIGAMSADDQRTMQNSIVRDDAIRNAAGVGTGAAGGYAVPLAFRDKFVETMKWYGPMLNEAEVINTESGVNLPWPTNDDTANVGAILGENTQVTEQDVTLGTASLDAYMYTSKLVRVSLQLLQDRPDFDTWLAKKLGERVGRILNQHFTTGTGTAQPDGIVTSATVGVTGTGSFASTGGVAYANLVDLTESLDPAYGGGAGLKFMFHQTARKAVRKIVDTAGRPIWEPSVQAGVPDSLMGYGYILNNDMPTLAASSKSVLFGNIEQAYAIRLVTGLSTLRLTERYADYLQVGFLAFQRADGTMQDSNAVRVFQTTATA
jgi:HK97 family phage major capsid protein